MHPVQRYYYTLVRLDANGNFLDMYGSVRSREVVIDKMHEIVQEGETPTLVVTDDQTLQSSTIHEMRLTDYPESATYVPNCTEEEWHLLRDRDRDVWLVQLFGGSFNLIHHPWQIQEVAGAEGLIGPWRMHER